MHVAKHKKPEEKYVRPVASSHELGWEQRPLVKENPHFREWSHHARSHGLAAQDFGASSSVFHVSPLFCIMRAARNRFRRRMYDVTQYGEQYMQMVHASPHDRRGGARQ